MRRRFFTTTVLLVAFLSGGVFATRGDGVGPSREWAVVYLAEPTLIGSIIVQGPVIFTHDDERMARGKACTTVQLFEPGKGPLEEIASFHCIPRSAPAPHRFTIKTRPNTKMGYGCVLTEFQFAEDGEAHGVPTPVDAH
jgi:hypothetical protein